MRKWELYYQVAHAQLMEQERRLRALRGKATSFIGITTTLVGITGLVLSGFPGASVLPLSIPFIVLMIASAIAFLGALGCGLWVLWPRTWRSDPNLRVFSGHLPEYEDDVLVEWAGDQLSNAVEANEVILNDLVRVDRAGIIALTFMALLLVGLVVSSYF